MTPVTRAAKPPPFIVAKLQYTHRARRRGQTLEFQQNSPCIRDLGIYTEVLRENAARSPRGQGCAMKSHAKQ